MKLFENNGIVEHWVGTVRLRYRWPFIKDALLYLWNAVRGFHIVGIRKTQEQ